MIDVSEGAKTRGKFWKYSSPKRKVGRQTKLPTGLHKHGGAVECDGAVGEVAWRAPGCQQEQNLVLIYLNIFDIYDRCDCLQPGPI